MTVVLAAAQDTGGANALCPVINTLGQYADVQVRVVASGTAAGVFCRNGVAHQKIDPVQRLQKLFDDSASKIMLEIGPDVLLTGTSWGPSLEKALAELSQARGIQSLAVLDMWSFYRERFEKPPTNNLSYLPTKVAVMDQQAFDESVLAGLPRESLVITGQPYLEIVRQRVQDPQLKQKAIDLRRDWLAEAGAPEDALVVLFVSEPIERDLGPSSPYHRGYTEIDALEGLAAAAAGVERRTGQSIVIVLKPHPEQETHTFNLGPLAARRTIPMAGALDPLTPVIASGAVVGMTSMLLIEAAIAGKSTVSFQPGLSDQPTLVGSRLGVVDSVSSSEELEAFLMRTKYTDAASSSGFGLRYARAHEGAAKRIAGILLGMVNTISRDHDTDRPGYNSKDKGEPQ